MDKHATVQEMLGTLIGIGRTFSQGKSFPRMFIDLMDKVCTITGAEGGSLYIYDEMAKTLKIVVMRNTSLGIEKVVESFDALHIKGFIEVPTHTNGVCNSRNVSVCSFMEKRKVLIVSLEESDEFDFTNTRKFDSENSYKTRNLAVLPLTGHGDGAIGVLQLINCNDDVFSGNMQSFIDAIIGQMGMMLNNALLVNESQELMSSIINMIGAAIDEKSPHTAGHCQRVVELTMMIADTMHKDKTVYKNFEISPEERRELRIAALLHDVGKIITPTHILDKPTKLHTLNDKINLLSERLRSWELQKKLDYLKSKLREEGLENLIAAVEDVPYEEEFKEDCEFLGEVNKGNIFVDEAVQKRLDEMSSRIIDNYSEYTTKNLINNEELSNLKISRGTLNPNERKIMEEHVSISIRLLSSIPWPSNLQKVVEYAGAHHENINGTGYPNRLTGERMELPARILGIADRFEGLSAPDRPYRATKMTLSRVMRVMEDMASKEEIDRDMFNFFKRENLHMKYARKYLPKELIDC